MSFFLSGEQVLQKCSAEILEVKEEKRQMFVLTGVTNITFDPDVVDPSGSLVLTKPNLLADASALSNLQPKCSKGIKWEISKLLNKRKPNSPSKRRCRLMWERWNSHLFTYGLRDGMSHHSHAFSN